VRKWSKVLLWSVLFWACAGPARPPLHAPAPLPQVWTQECDGLRVQITLQGTRPSTLVSDVYLTNLSGQLLADIARVILAFTARGTGSTTTLVAQPTGAGHYVPAAVFPVTPSSWQVEVIVRRASGLVATCVFALNL
jgi:hypothetical protein